MNRTKNTCIFAPFALSRLIYFPDPLEIKLHTSYTFTFKYFNVFPKNKEIILYN